MLFWWREFSHSKLKLYKLENNIFCYNNALLTPVDWKVPNRQQKEIKEPVCVLKKAVLNSAG